MAVIDDAVILRLIVARLNLLNLDAPAGVAGVVRFLMPGDEEPSARAAGGMRWARLVSVDMDGSRQEQNWDGGTGPDYPAHATGLITLNLFCGPELMKESAGAYASGVAIVRSVIENRELTETSPGKHSVNTFRARHAQDIEPSDQRAAASGMMTIDFRACRTGGATLVQMPAVEE